MPADASSLDTTVPAPLRQFIHLNRGGTLASAVALGAVNAIWLRTDVLYLIPAVVMVTYAGLHLADRMLSVGRITAAVGVVAVGNWVVSVVIVLLLPWTLPVMVLTALMPIVLATPYGDRDRLWPFLVGTAGVLAGIGWLGIGRDDDGAVEDVADGIELGIVVFGLIATAVPIGVVVWQANRFHRANAASALALSEQLNESRRRVVVAGDVERARIERDLHDGAQQRLIAVAMRLRVLDGRSGSSGLGPLISEVEAAMSDIRRLSNGLSPALLETAGLGPALSAAARQVGHPVDTRLDAVGRFERSVETAFYFCGLEAMQNALKHADGRGLQLSLERDDDDVVLEVRDRGDGFDVTATRSSNGMVNMSDRMASIGGRLDVSSQIGIGTTVRAQISTRDAAVAEERP